MAIIEPLVPNTLRGEPRLGDWRFLNGILWHPTNSHAI